MTHTPESRSTALAGSRRVDVEATIAPILRRAMVRFDELELQLMKPEQAAAVLLERERAVLQGSPIYAIGQLVREFNDSLVSMAKAFQAGYEGR